jgi:pyruvate/2-oxoglutarate dehydrogenase complex dihydrolipoamide dehydrogenase (E3) component
LRRGRRLFDGVEIRMSQDFDAIIIGAGQAGPSLATRLTKAGVRIAFVERKLFGGTCVNTGCIPTKTLIANAHAAHMVRRAGEFGVGFDGNIRVDMKSVKARKDAVSAKSRTGVEHMLKSMDGCTVFEGHARFESRRDAGGASVRVGDALLSAPKIFLDVGGRAIVPDFKGIAEVPCFTNSTMVDVDFLPPRLTVVGGSYIGLEFAQMYRRFGSEVTVVEKGPRLIAHEDEDVSAAVKEILEKEGIQVRLNAECIHFENRGGEAVTHLSCANDHDEVVGSHVLLAIGRRPNTDDLGADKIGLDLNSHGYIQVDDQLRTNIPGIWAMGDCNGRGAFTHTSYNDYEIVAANLLDNDPRRVSDRILTYALYTDPPLGRAGMTENDVRKRGGAALIGSMPMSRVGRAVEKGETQGFMKVLVDAETKRILGASILGVGGDEAIHCILDVMYAQQPYTVLQRAVHIHPTVSELIPTMLGSLKPL